MGKIGICTLFHKNYNYGGILQAYALSKVITTLGFDVEVIDYDDSTSINPVYPNTLSRLSQYSLGEILSKIIEIFSAKIHSRISKDLERRFLLFDDFINSYIPKSGKINDSDLNTLSGLYSVFISGSDQVWNPNSLTSLYLQTFKTDDARKISYAASISRNSLSDRESHIMIPAIRNFDEISVRESTARHILHTYDVKNVEVVLDPTLLLEMDDWNKVCANRLIDEPYVLVYAFSELDNPKAIIQHYREKGKKVCYIPYAKQIYNKYDGRYDMFPMYDVGPAEFISLIRYSDTVITDSFHGAVFSIIYNKPLFVFERDSDGLTSKNSRLYDLLNTFNISDCLIQDFNKLDSHQIINYTEANSILNEKRVKSLHWLKKALQK